MLVTWGAIHDPKLGARSPRQSSYHTKAASHGPFLIAIARDAYAARPGFEAAREVKVSHSNSMLCGTQLTDLTTRPSCQEGTVTQSQIYWTKISMSHQRLDPTVVLLSISELRIYRSLNADFRPKCLTHLRRLGYELDTGG